MTFPKNKIKKIKDLRIKGFTYKEIAEKMKISEPTAIKYGKEESQEIKEIEEIQETLADIHDKKPVEDKDAQEVKEQPPAYHRKFEFIETIRNCEAMIEHIGRKEFGSYNHEANVLKAQYEYVLGMLRKGDIEGLDAFNELYEKYQEFDDKCNVIADLEGDAIRAEKQLRKIKEELEAQERIYEDEIRKRQEELRGYDNEIIKKETKLREYDNEIEKRQAKVKLLQKKEVIAQMAVDHLYRDGNEIIDRTKEKYGITLRFGQMREAIPALEDRIKTRLGEMDNIEDYEQLISNLSILKKPFEEWIEVVSVLPSDLFQKLCKEVEARKMKEPEFIQEDIMRKMQSNQGFNINDMLTEMCMIATKKAINGGDEFDQIMKMKKLQQMMQSKA